MNYTIDNINVRNPHVYHEAIEKYGEVVISPPLISMQTADDIHILISKIDGITRKVGELIINGKGQR